MFLISTPSDKGESRRHIQKINAHSAHIRHNSTFDVSRTAASAATLKHDITRTAQKHPPSKAKTHTMQQPIEFLSFDLLLQSTLDPFVRLPMALGSYERMLLHYCLTHGGRRITMPASQDVFDPTIYAASHLLYADKMYALVHLAMGEWMLCHRRRVVVSALAYFWRAQAYRYMLEILKKAESPFSTKISGLFQLILIEQVFCESNLQVQHLRALDQLLELRGGLQQYDACAAGFDLNPGVSFVTSFFAFTEIPLTNSTTFDSIIGRFSHSLGKLHTLNDFSVTRASTTNPTLDLQIYVERLLYIYLRHPSTPYRQRAGAFGFVFSLAMSLVAYELTEAAIWQFLIRLEQCMQASKGVLSGHPDLLCPIDSIPCSAMWLLGYVRSCTLLVQKEKETEISQASVDALRLLSYISTEDSHHLAKSIARSVFGISGKTSSVFDETKVEGLIRELRSKAQQMDNCSKQASNTAESTQPQQKS